MANSETLGRPALILVLCLPLAVLIGYLLADPLDAGNALMIALMVGILSIPLLIHGYHPLLIFAWNAVITPSFLPGQLFLWVPVAFVGLGFAMFNRFINPDARFISNPPITRSLLFLLIVVLGVAFAHGGLGFRLLGSESFGGKHYVYLVGAILGYFAFTSRKIPRTRSKFFVALFFLSALTALVPNLAYVGGRAWYFLYALFPSGFALEQILGDYSPDTQIVRALGLSSVATTLLCWVLARYGLRGAVNLRNPWALFLFVAGLVVCAFSGFRVVLAIFALTLLVQFFLEGLHRNKPLVLSLVAVATIGGAIVIPNAEKLPIVVQRTLTALPIRVDSFVRDSARGSAEWRFQMWRLLWPQVPQYLLTGKGFGIDPTDLAFAPHNARFGFEAAGALATGDYHSGPLTLIIPLGIWGVIGFAWFLIVSLKYLYRQYRYGDPELKNINTFLLTYFVARLILYIFVFGGFYSDFCIFTGLVGFSVSLNGTTVPQSSPAEADLRAEELVPAVSS